MMTIRHITSEGETTFGVEKVRFEKGFDTGVTGRPSTLFADEMPLTGGVVYVMNDRGSTVAKYDLDQKAKGAR